MTDIATQPTVLSDLVKQTLVGLDYCIEEVTVNEATETEYKVGQLLGKTTTGQYKVAVETATDGSAEFAGVFIGESPDINVGETTIAATTDTKVMVLVRGPIKINQDAVIFDASYDAAAEAVVFNAMKAAGIQLATEV